MESDNYPKILRRAKQLYYVKSNFDFKISPPKINTTLQEDASWERLDEAYQTEWFEYAKKKIDEDGELG